MNKVFISGINGNMGKRYSAILRYLDIPYTGMDREETFGQQVAYCLHDKDVDGVIIATPTNTHIDAISWFSSLKKPMLCEKPISLSPFDISESTRKYLTMVNQYKYIDLTSGSEGQGLDGITFYDYYHSGSDGIFWDCINIIGLSKSGIHIDNKSPVWKCLINGNLLNREAVDRAYISMVKDWVLNHESNFDYIVKSHKKVLKLLDSLKRDNNE